MNSHEDNERWACRMFPPIFHCQGTCVSLLVWVPGIRVDCMIRRESRYGFRFLIFSLNPGYCIVAFEIIIHLPTVGEFGRFHFPEYNNDSSKKKNLFQFTIN